MEGVGGADGLGKNQLVRRLIRQRRKLRAELTDGGYIPGQACLFRILGKGKYQNRQGNEHPNEAAFPGALPGFHGFAHGGVIRDDDPLRLFGVITDGHLGADTRCVGDGLHICPMYTYLVGNTVNGIGNVKMQILIPVPGLRLPQKGRLTLFVVIPFFVAEGGKKAGKEKDYANKERKYCYAK